MQYHPSEGRGETDWARYVTGFRDKSDQESFVTYEWMKPVFRELWKVFDEYLQYADDLPWIYTERSIVGLLTAAAFRADCVALEEYQEDRKDDKPMGRADWWMGTKEEPMNEILVEAKQMWLSSDARTWGDLGGILKRAGDQLRGYGSRKRTENFKKLVVCFVRPHFRAGENVSDVDLGEQFKTWCDEEAYWPEETDYFTCYWLKSVKGRGVKKEGHKEPYSYYPGLFICCREL